MHVDHPNAGKSSDPDGVAGDDTITAYPLVDLRAIHGSVSTSQAVELCTCAFNDINMDQQEWAGLGTDDKDQVCAHPPLIAENLNLISQTRISQIQTHIKIAGHLAPMKMRPGMIFITL
jgi:hypothetical protein